MKRAPAPAGIIEIDAPIDLGGRQRELPVTWWIPTDRTVVGVAWVQHGYARKPHYLAALAAALVEAGLLVAMPTVESFRRTRAINDNDHLDAIGRAIGHLADDGSALHLVAAGAAITIPTDAAERVVLVAHSAGCAVVVRAARAALREEASLRGVVLLDATDNLAKSLASSLPELAGTTVLGLFAQPSRCNRRGMGADQLRGARDGFVGVRFTTGTHCDAEGDSTDRVCRTLCGTPDPANVALLHELTTVWTSDLVAGTTTDVWRPGGRRLDAEIAGGRIEALFGTQAP